MVKIILFIFSLLFINLSFCQVEKGLLKATSTFSIGLQTEATQNYYLSGLLDYHLDDRFSIRGDGFFFLGSDGERVRFDRNHQLLVGGFVHFNISDQLFWYGGLQTGVAFSRGTEHPTLNEDGTTTSFKPAINPLGSVAAGIVYYAPKWFHLFIETRYIIGKHQSDSFTVHLDEWRFSFGLGFHINTN